MGTSIGKINLDLGINTSKFKSSLNSAVGTTKSASSMMGGSLGKIGGIVAAAFSVRAIVNFTKECLTLGSNLAEVQNVVHVTYGSMESDANSWAKSAMTDFGLSETVAKKYLGTFGAMSKSFGFGTKQSLVMSEALTGLAGDVASFYNISTDEAYTKLKSVYTGETESLKELGVVMTQNALDAFAMANGYGKTTSAMSEQEKVSLRLAFVQDKLSAASGDFVRTSDGWANQTRVLSLRFDSLKASLGQGFINVLTPLIKGLNEILASLQRVADKFAEWTSDVFGFAGKSTGGTAVAAGMDEATNATNTAIATAKKYKLSLTGLDEFNVLGSASDDNNNTASTGTAPADAPVDSEKIDKASTAAEGLKKVFDSLGIDRAVDNINKGIQSINFEVIKENLQSSFENIKPIAAAAAEGLKKVTVATVDGITKNIGKRIEIMGKYTEIATGAVADFLDKQSPKITKWIGTVSDSMAKGCENIYSANYNVLDSYSEVLTAWGPILQETISGFLVALSDSIMTVVTIFSDMWLILTEKALAWTEENKALIDGFFNSVFEIANNVVVAVTDIVGGFFGTLEAWWNDSGKKVWGEIVDCIGDIIAWVVRLWNEFVSPIISKLIGEIQRLWAEHLQPLWQNILDFLTSIWNGIKFLWDEVISPIVEIIMEYVAPVIKNVISSIIEWFGDLIGMISDVIGGILKALGGLIDFVTGIFTGDWEKAWNGIKDFVSGIWDAIWGIIKGVVNMIIDGINMLWSGLYGALRAIVNGVGGMIEKLGDVLGQDWGFSIPEDPPKIPRLAQGGYVKANQPRLAMIGDNKTQGEIVAPEGKIAEIVAAALAPFATILDRLSAVINSKQGSNGETHITLVLQDGTVLLNAIVDANNKIIRQTGKSPIKITT